MIKKSRQLTRGRDNFFINVRQKSNLVLHPRVERDVDGERDEGDQRREERGERGEEHGGEVRREGEHERDKGDARRDGVHREPARPVGAGGLLVVGVVYRERVRVVWVGRELAAIDQDGGSTGAYLQMCRNGRQSRSRMRNSATYRAEGG